LGPMHFYYTTSAYAAPVAWGTWGRSCSRLWYMCSIGPNLRRAHSLCLCTVPMANARSTYSTPQPSQRISCLARWACNTMRLLDGGGGSICTAPTRACPPLQPCLPPPRLFFVTWSAVVTYYEITKRPIMRRSLKSNPPTLKAADIAGWAHDRRQRAQARRGRPLKYTAHRCVRSSPR
jgi:hypothetical protein